MNFKIRNCVLISSVCLLLTSCGDLFMQGKDSKDVSLSQFATCKLDTAAFGQILERNIKGDILCMKEQLHMFMDIVDTDRPGYVSQDVLVNFVKNGPMNMDQKIVPLLDAFFDLSYIVLGGDNGYIPRQDVDRLIDLTIFFNAHMWKIYRYFISTDTVNYHRHSKERNEVYNEFVLMANEVKSIFRQNREEIARIDFVRLMERIFSENDEVLTKIKSLLFLKKVFIGGNITELNHIEAKDILDKVPDIAAVAFDLVKIRFFGFTSDHQTMLKFFLQDIQTLKGSLFYDNSSLEAVMSIYDIIGAVEEFLPDFPFELRKYINEIQEIKVPILGSGGEFITNRELLVAFDHATKVLSKGEMFYRIYSFFSEELNKTDPISHDFSEFPVTSSYEKEVLEDFTRIVNDYQFVKGNNPMPTFHWRNYRNALGYFEIATLEYGVKTLMAYYGSPHEKARGGYHMTLDQTYKAMLTLKWFLKDVGIITIGKKGGGEVLSATQNLVLMSTLFQYQSDGCNAKEGPCMEVPEITEFLVGLLAAVQVRDFFSEKMEQLCAEEVDEFNRFPVSCFRRNFINVLEAQMSDGRSLAQYMPLMYDYILSLTKDLDKGDDPSESKDYVKFLSETEAFTRTCTFYDKKTQAEPVPMKVNDAFAVFAGLINVESSLIRHDTNRNNKLDGLSKSLKNNEVLVAYYDVYQGAIKGLVAPNGGFMEKMARPIFQYLVKYGKVPDTSKFSSIWSFVKFMLKINKRADASRTTVATILKVIGEQTPSNPFKCEECLRNPTVECEPEGDEWNKNNY